VAKSKLAFHGITAVLRYEAIGRELGITVDGLGKVEVLVGEGDLARARALLESPVDGEEAPDATSVP
jgi:hypothetical protein